jgi:putative transposase
LQKPALTPRLARSSAERIGQRILARNRRFDAAGKHMKKKRHTPEEIVAKLRQADEMIGQGKLHSEVAKALGVSMMTYHRWRKARAAPQTRQGAVTETTPPPVDQDLDARIAALEVENAQLRRLVTDLLLEKLRLEEAMGGKRSGTSGQ